VNSPVALAPTFNTENALTTNALGTVGGNNLDHNFKIEYNEVWNFNVERELTPGTVFSLAYIGSRTVLNVPLPGPGAIAARRPIPQLSQISDIRWNGWASYHAFTLTAKRRFTQGLLFNANWTWSHSIDDASDPGATLKETNLPQNVYDLAQEKASSSFDHRQRVVVSFIYQLPIARKSTGLTHALLGDWQAGGNFTAQSGAPFTVNFASDQAISAPAPRNAPISQAIPTTDPRVVRYLGVFAARALYFRHGPPQRRDWTGPPRIRPFATKGHPFDRSRQAAVPRRSV